MSLDVRVIHQVDGTPAFKVQSTLAVVEEWPEGDLRYDVLPQGASTAWLLANGYTPGPNGWYKDMQTGVSTRKRFFALDTEPFTTVEAAPPEPEPDE